MRVLYKQTGVTEVNMVVYIFFFFTHCFEFQNIVLVSFFSKTVFNLGNQIAGGQNLYQPPNHCRIVSER